MPIVIKELKQEKKYKGPLPKSKPRTSTNPKTGATRGAGDNKEYMEKAAKANQKYGGGKISKYYSAGGTVITGR